MFVNWNGKVVIIFNHETWLSNLSLLCDVSQHLNHKHLKALLKFKTSEFQIRLGYQIFLNEDETLLQKV